jgi:hypothetical protein
MEGLGKHEKYGIQEVCNKKKYKNASMKADDTRTLNNQIYTLA